MRDDLPNVTVIMPVRNEADSIRQSLGAVLAQDYPANHLEILVIDGDSDDGTREIVKTLMDNHSTLCLLDNPQQITSAALNVGIRHACGKYIVRVDAHTLIATDYLYQCVVLLESTGVANVGGRMQPVGQNYVGPSDSFEHYLSIWHRRLKIPLRLARTIC